MSGLEERVREAYLAVADLVREDAVPAGAPTRRADSRRAHHARWIAPVATAATVAVLAVTGGVILPHVLSGQHARAQAHSSHAARAQGHSPHAARAHRATIPGLPEFSVVSTQTSGGLEVIQTATGHVTGQVTMPAGQIFSHVAGDRSDRTYYVATQQVDVMATCRAYFYRFSVSADGQASALTPLPGSGQAGVLPTALAASADGRKLAFSITRCGGSAATTIPPSQQIGYIGLLDTASGKITRHWTYTEGEDYATSMSLTPDGNLLAFAQYLPDGSAIVAKTLRTDTPSGTVDQASTVVGASGVQSLSVGAALYGCIEIDKSRGRIANQLGVYSLATGHLAAVLHTWRFNSMCSLAPNPVHGDLLVVIETMLPHTQTPFVPRLRVRVLAIDASTGRMTTLLKTNTYENNTGIPTLIGW